MIPIDLCPKIFLYKPNYLKVVNIDTSHCSKLEIVLNENDTPQNQQFLLFFTPLLPKESRLQKSIDIQG